MQRCSIVTSSYIKFIVKEFLERVDTCCHSHGQLKILEIRIHSDPCVEYTYQFKYRKYKVLIDSTITTFDDFTDVLLLRQLPVIPNRVIMSPTNSANIERINEFLGPTCDFYSGIPGTIIDLSIICPEYALQEVMDTYGNVYTVENFCRHASTAE